MEYEDDIGVINILSTDIRSFIMYVLHSKVSKVIGVLRRLKSLLPLSALVLIYNSLIQPHFDYCSVIWDNLAGGLGQKLQRMQNRAARIITGSDYYTRSSEILRSLNWINLEDRRAIQFKKLMYKTANNMVPSYLTDNLFARLQCMSTTCVEQIINFLFLDPCQNIVRKALVIEVQFCGTTCPSKYPVHSLLVSLCLSSCKFIYCMHIFL